MDRYKELNYFSRPSEWNNFSYWFPKIENCGMPVPESVVIPVPQDVQDAFYMENGKDFDCIAEFTKKYVEPAAKKLGSRLFVKNGGFSNKFDAGESCLCICDASELALHITKIQYESLCFETGGEEEIVVRKQIPYISELIPCIYKGLPFRPEFRVFYDFDLHEVLFTANYWDYEYCRPHLFDATDKIIFDKMRPYIEHAYDLFKEKVASAVSQAMEGVTDLTGPWSVDVMLENYPITVQKQLEKDLSAKYHFTDEEEPQLWLIDMAKAECSAYWDKRPELNSQDV